MHVLILHSYHSTTEQGSAWHAVSEDRKLKQIQAHGIKSGEFAVLGFFWLHRKQCKQCQRESAEWGENTAGKMQSVVMNSLCIYKDRVRGCPSKLDQYPAADQAIEDRSLKTVTLPTYKSIAKTMKLLKFCLAHPKEIEMCGLFHCNCLYLVFQLCVYIT